MAEEKENKDDGKDEHGLLIHSYRSKVLVVMPAKDYDETAMRYARSALFNIHVGSTSVATVDDQLILGNLQDEFQVDAKLDGSTSLAEYAGVIFCGGPGATELAENADALRLAREASEQGKLLAAWGESVAVLARADVLRKKRVTGADSLREMVRGAGGRFTGNQVERHGAIVTGRDNGAGGRFGKLLVKVVGI